MKLSINNALIAAVLYVTLLGGPSAHADEEKINVTVATAHVPTGADMAYTNNGEASVISGEAVVALSGSETGIKLPAKSSISWKEKRGLYRVSMVDAVTIDSLPSPLTLASLKKLLDESGYEYLIFKLPAKGKSVSDAVISSAGNTDGN